MKSLFDTTQAVMDYLNTNMVSLVGKGGITLGIYKDYFPQENKKVVNLTGSKTSRTSISVSSELSGSLEYMDIIDVGIRLIVRAEKKKDAWLLMVNADKLLNLMVRKSLNSEVQLVLCKRNSGPSQFPGFDDGLDYYSALYSCTMRRSDA